MFNHYAMYDEDIIESAEQVSAGELILPLEELDFLLKRTVDLSTRQKLENKLIFGVLLEKMARLGIDLNSALMKGRTPAYILAKEYSMSGYKDEPDSDEESLARAAEEYFSVESLEMLNSLGTSAAHEAVRGNHFLMLSVMLKKGVNVNLSEDSPGVAGNTLLHTACEYCLPGIARILMEAGADDTPHACTGISDACLGYPDACAD